MGSPAQAKTDPLEAAVAEYLASGKSWKPDQYRLERKGTDDQGNTVVWAVYLEDERNPHPGGGESVELLVDRTNRVIRERHWQ